MGLSNEQFLMWIECWQDFIEKRSQYDKTKFDQFFTYLKKVYGQNTSEWSKFICPDDENGKWELYTGNTNPIESLNRVVNRFCGNYKKRSLNTAVKHIHQFLEFEVEEYEKFHLKPCGRKQLSSFYKNLCRLMCRQKTLSEAKRQIDSVKDIAVLCHSLLEAEDEADQKSRNVQSFKHFAVMQCIKFPKLKYLTEDILDLPDFNIPKPITIANHLQNETPVDSFLDSTCMTDSPQVSLNATENEMDSRVFNDDCLYSSRQPDTATPPPLGLLMKHKNYSSIEPTELRPVYQETHIVSSNLKYL